MTNKNLQGRIALITGGARGIGKAISENLAQQGCNVIIKLLHYRLAELNFLG